MQPRCSPSRALALLAPMLAFSWPATAERACFISYAGFEEKVPHLDIDICPGHVVTPEEGFCRVALQGDAILVYLFRHIDGEPCLTAVDRYEFNSFIARFGTNYAKP